MKKIIQLAVAATFIASPALADVNANENINEVTTEIATNEGNHEEGFLTHYLNEAIASGMEKADAATEFEYGSKVTKYASAPTFGGYYMGGFYYSSKDGAHSGDGFKQKNVRMYVSGTLFNDFSYLMQVQINNDKFHMKDYWLEWKKYKEFQIKGGQFIRVFGYENPYNPFEYHDGAYSQLTQKLCGQADRCGADNGGGRDQGIQVQGDLLPSKDGKFRFLHYQFMVSNGQTINTADANSQKDLSGMIQIQPVEGLKLAVWGWTGNITANNNTVSRDRYMFSVFYDKDDWTARAEYAHSTGKKLVGDDPTGKAQGWYGTVGVPCKPWMKLWFKYDAYQDFATKDTQKTIYSIAPNFRPHKNLWFQPRIAYVNDKISDNSSNWWEASVEMGVRF